ncbi:MAG TPA: lysophospholipase [Bacteroidales bacterium]|nr:lysophospholipase [Bacteroidales bacterium]
MDLNLRLSNGQLLNGIIKSPGENAAGVILLIHGIGEHVRRYNHWADLFRKENFAFAALDLPGHGKSDGGRGKIKKYSDVYEIIDLLIKTGSRTFPGVPLYLYGHSMGGGMVLDYTLRYKPKVKGVIVTSPWLKLSFEPPRFKMLLAQAAKSVLPGLVQPSGLNTIYLSHDSSVVDAYNNDPLVHDKISVAFFAGANSAAEFSLENASALKVPLLLVHGSDDMICSPEGSREFASKTPLAELKIWDGGYHELHNEPFREDVFKFILEWIRRHK